MIISNIGTIDKGLNVKRLHCLMLQRMIPAALLEHYLSMTDPSRAQTVDTEITKHCAFSLPAVAFTLGRENWPCLKELYETLAADMQVHNASIQSFSLFSALTIKPYLPKLFKTYVGCVLI